MIMPRMTSVVVASIASVLVSCVQGADYSDCNAVVFDQVDKDLHVRTMVVEDYTRQRSLILVPENDTSMPCKPRWWLDHNPQGVVQCLNKLPGAGPPAETAVGQRVACAASECQADPSQIELGYVRTMLASAVFQPPAPHTMSALCIELGCKSRIRRTRVEGSLLEKAPEAKWTTRAPLERVLVIGLGSSTMALWLRNHLPETELHVAELVPGVAAAAPCFGLHTNGSDALLHLHVGDGRGKLESFPDGHFDAILVDAFDRDASLPPCFRTRQFFESAKRKLTPGGSMSFNLFADGRSAARIIKALSLNFDASRIWVGNAPGAEGIQEVVTATTGGHPSAQHPATPAAVAQSKRWFDAAHFRLLPSTLVTKYEAFEDRTECPHH